MFEAVELGLKVSKEEYDRQVPDLRIRLLHAQEQLKDRKFPVLILIHGADGAGKGEVLNTLHEWMDPRFLQTTAFGPRSEEERARPEDWRFWRAMPPKGRTGLFFCSWYTRPIIDRVTRRSMPLSEAAKCALISMDSTIRSNLTVGLPLDLVIVRRDEHRVASHVDIGPENKYFQVIRGAWGEALREAFSELPNPDWLAAR